MSSRALGDFDLFGGGIVGLSACGLAASRVSSMGTSIYPEGHNDDMLDGLGWMLMVTGRDG